MSEDVFDRLNQCVPVPCETQERLLMYCELLLKWQSRINLISRDTVKDVWSRHFLDSLQLMKYIDDTEKMIVDLGSGSGFPGMVLAIMGYKNVHLIESDTRKAVFLKEVERVTGSDVFIHNCRIEESPIKKMDVCISRACASLDKLLELSFPFMSNNTICFFHKGRNYSIENQDALLRWKYNMEVIPSVVDVYGVILKLSNIKRA